MIWPRYKGFNFEKKHFQKELFFRPVNEKRHKSAGWLPESKTLGEKGLKKLLFLGQPQCDS